MMVERLGPYAGELVFTAFSGSHQDAINKVGGLYGQTRFPVLGNSVSAHRSVRCGPGVRADCPDQQPVGQGGAAFVMASHFGLHLPKAMHRSLAPW